MPTRPPPTTTATQPQPQPQPQTGTGGDALDPDHSPRRRRTDVWGEPFSGVDRLIRRE